MKKRILLLSIAIIVIVTFVSCEGDIFQSISDFMGQTGSNVLLDGGAVTVPTENVDDLVGTLGETTDAPVTPAQVQKVKDSVKKIIESEGETDAAKGLLEEEVGDEEVPDELQGEMDDLETDLGLDPGSLDIKNKGDLARAILLKDLKDKKPAAGASQAVKAAYVEEARIAIEFVKKTSPIGKIQITTALTDLLNGFLDESRIATRGEDPIDIDMVLNIVKPIFTMYYDIIDTNGGGIVTAELVAASKDAALIRQFSQTAAEALPGSGAEKKLSDMIFYASSVILSGYNDLIPAAVKAGYTDPTTLSHYDGDFVAILNLVNAYIESGQTTLPSGPAWFFIDVSMRASWSTTFDSWLNLHPEVAETLLAISRAIPDNEYITGLLEDFIGGDD
jgi:hypothetical protein